MSEVRDEIGEVLDAHVGWQMHRAQMIDALARIVAERTRAAVAEALSNVAGEWQMGGWLALMVPDRGPMTKPQIVTDWLRNKAALAGAAGAQGDVQGSGGVPLPERTLQGVREAQDGSEGARGGEGAIAWCSVPGCSDHPFNIEAEWHEERR